MFPIKSAKMYFEGPRNVILDNDGRQVAIIKTGMSKASLDKIIKLANFGNRIKTLHKNKGIGRAVTFVKQELKNESLWNM